MTGTMIELSVAAIAFVGGHVGVSSTRLRADLVARLGERAYLGLYSAVALILIAWLVRSYGAAPDVELWRTPAWLVFVPLIVMAPALLLVVGGVTRPNPTAAGMPAGIAAYWRPRGVLAVTRHPVMWGIALWALSHLVVNGDLASLVFFGAFALLALAGARLIDGKKRRAWPPGDWQRLAAVTSYLPFAALVAGRATLDLAGLGWWRPLVAGLLYIALVLLHGTVLGVPVVVG